MSEPGILPSGVFRSSGSGIRVLAADDFERLPLASDDGHARDVAAGDIRAHRRQQIGRRWRRASVFVGIQPISPWSADSVFPAPRFADLPGLIFARPLPRAASRRAFVAPVRFGRAQDDRRPAAR